MTDDNFGDAAPLMEVTGYQVKENLGRIMGEGKTPVVTGYIGATQGGEMTTFGRGVIMAAMFLGRVGLLMLMAAVVMGPRPSAPEPASPYDARG